MPTPTNRERVIALMEQLGFTDQLDFTEPGVGHHWSKTTPSGKAYTINMAPYTSDLFLGCMGSMRCPVGKRRWATLETAIPAFVAECEALLAVRP